MRSRRAVQPVIYVQARTGSTRLPGKVLRRFGDSPSLLEHVVARLAPAALPITLLTTTNPEDDVIQSLAAGLGLACFRGSEVDVLERFVAAAAPGGDQHIVRVCADNPFLDPSAIRTLCDHVERHRPDYAGFVLDNGLFSIRSHLGLFAEYASAAALEQLHRQLPADSPHREHVTSFLYTASSTFQVLGIPASLSVAPRSDIRLTVDTLEDFQLTEALFRDVVGRYGPEFTLDQLIATIDREPALRDAMRRRMAAQPK